MDNRPNADVIERFDFVDAGRTFTCSIEALHPARAEAWWWFRVSTGDRHRYAPFRTAAGDTRGSVQSRIVAFYDDLVARRAGPPTGWWSRGNRVTGGDRR